MDALLETEARRRFGAGQPRKRRQLKQGSRHVPVEIQRAVWRRDGAQCSFEDSQGQRCSERSFLTLEHRQPFARGGPPTTDNLCLLCRAHNLARAREVFGEEHIEASIRTSCGPMHVGGGVRQYAGVAAAAAVAEQLLDAAAATRAPASGAIANRVLSALCHLGFRRGDAVAAIGRASGSEPGLEFEPLLRKSLTRLVPAPSPAAAERRIDEGEAAA